MPPSQKLFTKPFLALNGICFLTFCNMAVFFQFYGYLHTLPIAAEWYGFLIAVFSITGLILRPILSPFLHMGNARTWILISTAGVALSLLSYNLAQNLWSMTLVRAVHGITYVVLGIALNTSLVNLIPAGRSGQAFGLVTVITLLPFAVVPPLLKPAVHLLGGFIPVLNFSALLMLLVFPLVLVIQKPHDPSAQTTAGRRPGLHDLVISLKDLRVSLLLLLMLLLYSSFTPIFFFLESYAQTIPIRNPGLFFTLSTLSEIGVRLLAGTLFDRLNKPFLIAGSLFAIGLGYLALAACSGPVLFYSLGVFLGLGWGVAMPVLNALLFDISAPHLKALNTNLGVQMFQGGFFIGPLLGGLILAHGNFKILCYFCALLVFISVGLTAFLSKRHKT
ncbi:MAG: MFS transporter [Desulfobacteraceae bacterium]|nr:MAG: MFS transporter [Desulfobacteraceae bacterium]